MAPVPLNVAPVFRPWRQAGIRYLLSDETTAEAFRQARIRPVGQRTAETAEKRRNDSSIECPAGSLVMRKGQTAGSEEAALAPSRTPAGQTSAGHESSGQMPPSCPIPGTSAVPSHPAPPRRLPPEHWPDYWRSLLERTPCSPEVVWTYPSLSRDLGGAAEAAHRNFLRRLLGDMGMPRGTNAFWPLNAYPYPQDGSEHSVDASMFMSGIDALDPDMVVLMCGRAPAELGLGGVGLLMPTVIRGRRFVVTPHVDDLILQPRRYMQLVTFLKGLLAGR